MKSGPVHFDASGSGEIPIICIHGWACEGGQFLELSRALGPQFRVYRPDLPGHGRTPLGTFVPSYDNYTSFIVDFALAHGLENPVLLGHSMGGVLALMAAATHRLQPRAIINLDGSLPPAQQTLAGLAMVRSWLDKPDFRERLAAALRESFFLPHERDARSEAIIQQMCSAPEAVLRFLPEHFDSLNATHILPKVQVPTLYIGADHPRFDVDKVALAQLRLEHFAGSGHFLHLYALPQVAASVEEFLRSAPVLA